MEYFRATSLGEEEAFMEQVLSSLKPSDVFYDIGYFAVKMKSFFNDYENNIKSLLLTIC